ncbi:hypothetical protein ACFL08_04950 [Patescibacteria group bacterium]
MRNAKKMIIVLLSVTFSIFPSMVIAAEYPFTVDPFGCAQGFPEDTSLEVILDACGIIGIPDEDDTDEFRCYMPITNEGIPVVTMAKRPQLYVVNSEVGTYPTDNFTFNDEGQLCVYVGNGDNGSISLDEETEYVLVLDDGSVTENPKQDCVFVDDGNGRPICEDDEDYLLPVISVDSEMRQKERVIRFTVIDGIRQYTNR